MTISIPVIVVIVIVIAWSVFRKKRVRCTECGDRMFRRIRPVNVPGSEEYWECTCGHTFDIPGRA